MHCDQSNIDEMRVAYAQLMSAYSNCKKYFSLDNDFFKDKLFSAVLRDVFQILCQNEQLIFEQIEKNQIDDSHHQLPSGIIQDSQSSGLNLNFESCLQNQIHNFTQFDDVKQTRFIIISMCLTMSFYQEPLNDKYQEYYRDNYSEDVFDFVWQTIADRDLVAKITETGIWHKPLRESIPEWCSSFLNDIFPSINDSVNKFFRDRIKHISQQASEYNAVLFPPKMDANGLWYCDLPDWKRIIKKFGDYDLLGSAIEKPEHNFAIFEGPILASIDGNGDISGTIWSDNRPVLIKYVQGPNPKPKQN